MNADTFGRGQTCGAAGCIKTAAGPITGMCPHHGRADAVRRFGATSDGTRGKQYSGNPKMSDEDVASAKRMYSAFKTRREIAKHFGVSLTYLRERMRGDR